MSEAITPPKELKLELGPTKEFRRRLVVTKDLRYGDVWAGVYPPAKYSSQSLAFANDRDRVHITRYKCSWNDEVSISLIVGVAQFPISEAEVEKLVETFGFEVCES